jgi:formamidopyrimidine-DNA glycosylase
MPELPEVETILNAAKPLLYNNILVSIKLNRPNLRTNFSKLLYQTKNLKINNIQRRAKYMLWSLENNQTIILHLGMSGKLLLLNSKQLYTPNKHDHVEFIFSNNIRIILNDPRRFGLVEICDTDKITQHKLFANLGPEPLSEEFNTNYFYNIISKSSKPIKNLIMDNSVVVGIGNIYASESLFKAKINPLKSSKTLLKPQAEILVKTIKETLLNAIKAGGSTLRDYQQLDGSQGYFQHKFKVYGKENINCSTCTTLIKKIIMAGRSTFYCVNCQK